MTSNLGFGTHEKSLLPHSAGQSKAQGHPRYKGVEKKTESLGRKNGKVTLPRSKRTAKKGLGDH